MSRKFRPWLMAGIVLLLLCCLGCSAEAPRLLGPDSGFHSIAARALPDYVPEEPASARYANLFASVHGGNVAECLDVQAIPALSGPAGGVYSPQILLTVVFAVDSSKTDLHPDSWESLEASGLDVGMADNALFRRILLAAAAYGLEGEAYHKETALQWLASLREQGRFFPGKTDCPVTLCFDTEAVRRIQQGEALLIMVPRTLSFTWGLYSAEPLSLSLREDLLEDGFRLPDGTARCSLYPEDYSSAVRVPDFSRFLRETQDATRDLRRSVLHVRLFGSADGRESTLLFFSALLLILLWTASTLHRCPDREMRRWVWLITLQIAAWLLVTLFKYQLYDSSLLTRILWYSYYLFLMGLPLTMLYITAVIDRPEGSRRVPRWLVPILLLYPLLVLMVFTNDFHQLVFRFDPTGDWDSDYSYGPGYAAIFSYCIAAFLASVVLLIVKSRKSPKRLGWLGPILVALLLVAYNVCYILKVALVRDSNLSLVFCLFSVLFLEAALNAGLLPTNTRYRELFSSSPLSMQLLDRRGVAILAAADAEPLTPLERQKIVAGAATLRRGENTVLHTRPIHGGTALWQEDLTGLSRQQEKLFASIRQMEAANTLIQQEGEIRRRKMASEIQVQLYEQLEADLHDKTQELARLIRNLPKNETRKQQIARIPLLLCHIKRRSNLFFLSRQGDWMSGNEMAVYLDELSEFSAYAGIHALVRCGVTGPVRVETVTLCYDFYFSMLSWVLEGSGAVLIGQLEEKEGTLTFSVLSSEATDSLHISDDFLEKLRLAGGSLARRSLEDSESIWLTFPGKGGDAM